MNAEPARNFTGRDMADLPDAAIIAAIDNARPPDPAEDWPDPDMAIAKGSRRAPPAMPDALFGPAYPLLADIAAGTATAPDYAACAFLSACASLIGGKRRVRPYAASNWQESPILWLGIVGDPSSRKSPALDAIIDPLRALERDGAEAHKADLRAFKQADAGAKAVRAEWEKALAKAVKEGHADLPAMPEAAHDPEMPARRRTLVMDATPEAVATILSGNPQGTLHFRDELAGWIQSFERYSPGGREFWLEAYGGRSFVIDRKGAAAPLTVPFNGISVLGGVQPEKLAAAMLNSPDDGLVARFLWTWPEKLSFTRPTRIADASALEVIYRRLEGLQWGQDFNGDPAPICLPLSATASDLFEAWQGDNAALDDDAPGLLKSFYGKLDGALLRVALTAELAKWASTGGDEPREVSLATIEAAAEWIDDYAKPMAARVYGDAALPVAERNAAMLARYILKAGLRTINKRDLKRTPHKSALPTMRDAKALDAAIDVLADADWIRPSGTRDSDIPGRASTDYAVNPAVHGRA